MVAQARAPDWCIAAGFVRNRVWDHLHGVVPARAPVDIDVLYFDAGDVSRESEATLEECLQAFMASHQHVAIVRGVDASGPGDPRYFVAGIISLEDF